MTYVDGWPCRDDEHAARLRRIFAGDLDASPGRRLFHPGGEVRMCDEGCRRPAATWSHKCSACQRRLSRERKAQRDADRATSRPVLPVLFDPASAATTKAERVAGVLAKMVGR